MARESEPESENKIRNRLQELEKQLLDDNEDEPGDDVSAITSGSEWSDTIQNLISPGPAQAKPISPSPTSSSSSSSSSAGSPLPTCWKQSLMEAASATLEGKSEVAMEILTRLSLASNTRGSPEQRLTAYMTAALKSRLNPNDNPAPVAELYGKEHMDSIQLLYEHSVCFQFGLMAANLAIIEETSDANTFQIIDFDIGQGGQYYSLLKLLSRRKAATSVKITAVVDEEERLEAVGERLSQMGERAGICVEFNAVSLPRITDLCRELVGCKSEEEVLVVKLAFKLHKMADESVTTENPRDELLRRVKGLRPRLVTVVEQEMNCNTAPFMSRVGECCAYYGALFESMDSYLARDNSDRVVIEEGLGRKLANSVACEGRDRVERCEVFGKWRARLGMAGFEQKALSQNVIESLRARANSGGTRVSPGILVKEENGGTSFGWMGRTLTVASAWR